MSRAFLPLLNLSPAPNYDAYLDDVVLLAHFDDWASATTFAAAINTTGVELTKSGDPTLSSAQVKFGGASLYCGAHNNDFAYAGQIHDGTSAFTWESWIYVTSNSAVQGLFAIGHNSSTTNHGVYITSGGVLQYVVNDAACITGTTTVTTNAWHHWAVSRLSGSTRLFLDGTQEGSTYTDSNDYASEATWIGGSNRPTVHPLLGYLDELRITVGAGRYAANFTPSAVAFPAA
jgi:hypothetical protein